MIVSLPVKRKIIKGNIENLKSSIYSKSIWYGIPKLYRKNTEMDKIT